jgi:hypothetical protein
MNNLIIRFMAQHGFDLARFQPHDFADIGRTVIGQSDSQDFVFAAFELHRRADVKFRFHSDNAAGQQTFAVFQNRLGRAVIDFNGAMGFQRKGNPAFPAGQLFFAGHKKSSRGFVGKNFSQNIRRIAPGDYHGDTGGINFPGRSDLAHHATGSQCAGYSAGILFGISGYGGDNRDERADPCQKALRYP